MSHRKQPEFLVNFAKQNRSKMTLPEGLLWRELKASSQNEFKFRKQVPLLDRFIADFVCQEVSLIIEVDGVHNHALRAEDDEVRTGLLEKAGYRVIRIDASKVLAAPKAVAEYMLETCRQLKSGMD